MFDGSDDFFSYKCMSISSKNCLFFLIDVHFKVVHLKEKNYNFKSNAFMRKQVIDLVMTFRVINIQPNTRNLVKKNVCKFTILKS